MTNQTPAYPLNRQTNLMIKAGCILFILFIQIAAFGQDADSLSSEETETPFRKGRWFTGLSGTIYKSDYNQSVGNRSVSNDDVFGYGIDITTGKFLADRTLLGLIFFIEKENSNQILYSDIESLLIGPYFRYYLSNSPVGSMYLGVGSGYNRYIDEQNVTIQSQLYDEILKGQGVSILGELGYGLNIKDDISFDLSVNYIAHYINGSFTNYQNETSEVQFWRRNFFFKFGFNVILDEFFF